jgi:CRP/FNR family cyclic AMP-dependent transcriptional regulator
MPAMTSHPIDRFQALRLLREQPWFAELPCDLQDLVQHSACTLRARRGQVTLPAGEVAQGWYAVVWGLVKLQSPLDEEQVSAFLALTAGEWFGEGAVMNDGPRRYEAVALRDTVLLCVPRSTFHRLMAHSLPFARAVTSHLNQRLGQAMAIIEASRTRSLEKRLALYLSRTLGHGAEHLQLSQEELGCLAGMSRQAVNRTLQVLQRRGLVTLAHGRVACTHQEALERAL